MDAHVYLAKADPGLVVDVVVLVVVVLVIVIVVAADDAGHGHGQSQLLLHQCKLCSQGLETL